MPSIAQQDYIIIDWEGKDSGDATKKAKVDAQLKNIYLANPLALFSVIFKDYGGGDIPASHSYRTYGRITAIMPNDSGDPRTIYLVFTDTSNDGQYAAYEMDF